DVSDGGLAVARAEAAIAAPGGSNLGCRVDLAPLTVRGRAADEALFGEGAGGFVVSGDAAALRGLARPGVRVLPLGEVVAGGRFELTAGEVSVDARVEELAAAWRSLAERLD
ncbi:MAG TPA: AIR synthase-related protein, partial [Solirubrobacterales bacterium]|nr:AIR synthase-related protein [Solirubrobacterales bacterium]